MENIIEITNLKKYFGEVKAVDGISFSVKKGELFAFLGLNGAGKSTTISVICGSIKKDGGEVVIGGKRIEDDPNAIKSRIGVVFQNSVLDKPLSVYENLRSRAALYGITGKAFEKRLSELSEMFELEGLMRRPVGKLSGGQRRRIDIARAMIHRPELLILDEPTTGLDPQTRQTVWRVIDELRKTEGITVFLTTHYMEEAAEADNVVILDAGRIAAEGSPLYLRNRFSADALTLYSVSEDDVKAFNLPYTKINGGFKIYMGDTSVATKLILKNPDLFRDYELTKGKMDDVFLTVTGKHLNGGESK
ncbi:MAG: ABC transporter ATP-binding protein [Clostridia bacterium]|nr:ABC transporter ATP-binding protein [Clostridia bacterium]